MTDVTAKDLKNRLGETTERAAQGERIGVTEGGRVRFALVPAEDLELLERLEDESDVRAAERVMAKGQQTIPAEEVFRKHAL